MVLEVEHDTTNLFSQRGYSGDLGNGEYAAWIMVFPGYTVAQLHLKGINVDGKQRFGRSCFKRSACSPHNI